MTKSPTKTTKDWLDVVNYLENNTLDKNQRVFLLNYFNKEINAFQVEDAVKIGPNNLVLANGRVLDIAERKAFLEGVHALVGNSAFALIADQVTYQAIKRGVHDATELDHLYFSKSALFFIDLFKKWIETLDKLN